MRLALFDLDHTLIPFDSGLAWLRFLVARGSLPAEAETHYLAECRRFMAGEIDVRALHRALVAPLRDSGRNELDTWLVEFEAGLAPSLPAAALALVARHLAAGDRCVLVTATTRFVAERYAFAFGIGEVLATEAVRDSHGRLTGETAGAPCVGAHKLSRLGDALTLEGAALADFERSWFYSDSAGDLPLLEAVSDPVAVRPDARLAAVAAERSWPVIELADRAEAPVPEHEPPRKTREKPRFQ